MAKQYVYTGSRLKRWIEKNWLLVPVILIGVIAVAILEATLLYRKFRLFECNRLPTSRSLVVLTDSTTRTWIRTPGCFT